MTDTRDEPEALSFVYTNWRGERDVRTVRPESIWWGSTEWHPEPGWLMTGRDLVKRADRDFALSDCDFTGGRDADDRIAAMEEQVARLTNDCGILLANIDYLEESHGEGPDGEDRALVEQIRRDLQLPDMSGSRPSPAPSEAVYLVWSNQHRAWWRANSRGYTRNVVDAGAYSRSEAMSISQGARDGWIEADVVPDEIAVCENDLPSEFVARRRGLASEGERDG